MRPRRTPTSNKVFKLEGGTEDNDLWVEVAIEGGQPTISSTWELSDEDRAMIAAGGQVELTVWGAGTPPVDLCVVHVSLGRRHD